MLQGSSSRSLLNAVVLLILGAGVVNNTKVICVILRLYKFIFLNHINYPCKQDACWCVRGSFSYVLHSWLCLSIHHKGSHTYFIWIQNYIVFFSLLIYLPAFTLFYYNIHSLLLPNKTVFLIIFLIYSNKSATVLGRSPIWLMLTHWFLINVWLLSWISRFSLVS